MQTSLVLTVIGADRPGVVEKLSETVASHGGSWVESRMSRLAGKFAGILRVHVAPEQASALTESLQSQPELTVVVEESDVAVEPGERRYRLEAMGHDRPKIIRDIARALAGRGVNVIDLYTTCFNAPFSGERLFEARSEVVVPADTNPEELREALDHVGGELAVDIHLDELDPADGA